MSANRPAGTPAAAATRTEAKRSTRPAPTSTDQATTPPERDTTPKGPASVTEVRELADWILTSQLGDGAIAHHADRQRVWSYLANFAAIGLVDASTVTGEAKYQDAAWRWLSWYGKHQDADGFVTDYVINADGTVTSTGDMDSTDAYAGTFLLSAHRIVEANPSGSPCGAPSTSRRGLRMYRPAPRRTDAAFAARPHPRARRSGA
ncbi:hypothetical protein [Micromonospora sp. NPDC049679]|uniref:hypothetical protein n=1 Tax=Micromonospora sp. NPDC049679 TaxID=3155920 RepID=UPI0033EAAFF4